ncbi:MAG: hypothetical protein V2A70_04270 [Candidatus Omnitrophota bacterium]
MYKSSRGQMALIMILLIGLALIFFAIAVNASRMAANKAVVTMAADGGASSLASQMASYGEYVMQVYLGGQLRKCSGTSVIVTIIVLIIVIIVIIISCYGGCYGVAAGVSLWGVFWGGMIVSAVLLAASVVVNVTVIQPGLTRQWNKWQSALSTMGDQYLEHVFMGVLPMVASDQVMVADRWDNDMDGLWYDSKTGEGDPSAQISRYAVYYTDRMKSIIIPPDNLEVLKLQLLLQAICTKLGLTSPTSTPGYFPAVCYTDSVNLTGLRPECNHCCVDRTMRPGECYTDTRTQADRDAGLPAWWNEPEVAVGCTLSNQYNYLYDVYYTAGQSDGTLVKMLGVDDGNIHNDPPPDYYKGEDSLEGGVFRTIWTIADSQPDVSKGNVLEATSLTSACHWCDAKGVGTCDPVGGHLYRPYTITDQLVLSDCSGDNCCTNFFKSDIAEVSPIEMDAVGNVGVFTEAEEGTCPSEDIAAFNWRKGADFGQDTFADNATHSLYFIKVASDPASAAATQTGDLASACVGTSDASVNNCVCSNIPQNADYFHDDSFDVMADELKEFKHVTDLFLQANTPALRNAMAADVNNWKQPMLDQARNITNWELGLTAWSDSIAAWLAVDGGTYAVENKWCVPVDSTGMCADEAAAIEANAAWGSLDSVTNCLLWNETNSTRFQTCLDEIYANPSHTDGRYLCSADVCAVVPRSLVSGFNVMDRTIACENQPYACGDDCGEDKDETCWCDESVFTELFISQIGMSKDLAIPQDIKMKKRYDYLITIKGIITPYQAIFDASKLYLTGMGDSIKTAVEAIVKKGVTAATKRTLGNGIIYGWASPRPEKWKSGGRSEGYLHVVKIEAVVPTRSTGLLSIGIDTCASQNSDKMPWVSTATHNWGSKRCYKLKDHSGCVGVRVIRYDEDHDPKQGGIMAFLSGLPLWRIIYHNPHSGGFNSGCPEDNPNCDIVANCFEQHYSLREVDTYRKLSDAVDGFPTDDEALKQAFMIGLPIKSGAPAELTACLSAAEKRLEKGVYAESCAKYEMTSNGMQVAFRKCSECCTKTIVGGAALTP